MTVLALDVEKRLGHFTLAAKFAAAECATALFGPSGAGKSTIVNLIAGLIAPDRGRITLDDTVLFDAAARIDVPPHRRRIGCVFQEGRLFPHLTVRRNLDYGRWMSGLARDDAAMATSSSCSTSAACSIVGPAGCRAASASASPSAGRC